MQTGQLTTIQAGAFLQPMSDGIFGLGSGRGGIDFAAFLLSLLSMESPPLEVEVSEEGKLILVSESPVTGETVGSPSPLLTTLLSNADTITPLSVNPEPQTHYPAEVLNLPANNRPQSAASLLNEHVGEKVLAKDFEAAIFAGESISNNSGESIWNNTNAAALFSLPENNAKAASVSSSPVKQAGQNIPENLTRPVPIRSQDAGLILSGGGVELPDWPGGPPNGLENTAAISISAYTGQGENSPQLQATGTQSTTIITGQETDVRSSGFVPTPVKADILLVPATQVSGSHGERTGITAENISAIFKDVEVESLKVPVNSSESIKSHQAPTGRAITVSSSPPTINQVVTTIGGEMVESQENSATPLPKNPTGISSATMAAQVYAEDAKTSSDSRSLANQPAVSTSKEVPEGQQKTGMPTDKNPAGNSPALKPNQVFSGDSKANSGPASSADQVFASGGKETRENLNQTVAAVDGEPTNGQHSAGRKQTASASTGPNPPGGLKIKSEGLRVNGETDVKPPPTSGHLESNVPVKGKADLPEPPRVQFTVEPESFRPSPKPSAEIRLRLHPDQLGMVKLQLRTVDNHLTARMVVQSSAARLAVEGNLTQLQRTMAEAGLVIDRFEVTVGHATSASTLYPDSSGQKRHYAYKPKANRRYQAAAGVQRADPGRSQPTGVLVAPGDRYHLNMVA